MPSPDLAADSALAGALVREAAELAARIRDGGLRIDTKSDASDLVTQADLAAESLILGRLRAERPLDSVVGEEGTDQVGSSGRTWVIDPVDGTYNFARGSDWWCSALALRDQDDVLLGAVHHAASGRTWVGGPLLPTTVDGKPVPRVAERARDTRCATTYLHPPFFGTEVGDAFVRALGQVGTLRMLGSASMDLMAIAGGEWDVLFQHSAPDWDRLPGAAVVRGAGGESRVVSAGGVDWHVCGAPGAVADVCSALVGHPEP